MVSHPDLGLRPGILSPTDLAGLARTFDDSAHAVWIHDLSGRCVYRNPAAQQTEPCTATDMLHEILGPDNRQIGRLRVRMA
jgi:PAS domain-containing protein